LLAEIAPMTPVNDKTRIAIARMEPLLILNAGTFSMEIKRNETESRHQGSRTADQFFKMIVLSLERADRGQTDV